MKPSRATLAFVTLASFASGQRTWIVDAYQRPGTDFTDLPPAIAAASAGDTLVVRSGAYSDPTFSKGLRVLGDQARIYGITIQNLPAGEDLNIRGFQIGAFFNSCLGGEITNSRGRIHFEQTDWYNLCPYASFPIRQARVHFNDCQLLGSLEIQRSTLVLTGSLLFGSSASATSGSPSRPGLLLTHSRVIVANSSVGGGGGTFSFGYGADPSPGIRLVSSDLWIAGDSRTHVSGGSVRTWTGTIQAPAIETVAGTLEIDPGVQLNGVIGGTPYTISGPVLPTFRRQVSLRGEGRPPGYPIAIEVLGPPDTPYLLLTSIAADPVATVHGELWLHPGTFIPLRSGNLGPGGALVLDVPLENDPLMLGLALTFQAVAWLEHSLALSTPVHVILG